MMELNIVVTIILAFFVSWFGVPIATPLDDYVMKADHHYTWQELSSNIQEGYDMYVLNMTSQKWKTEAYSSQSIWWHYVTVIVPRNLTVFNSAALLISDGKNTKHLPTNTDPYIAFLALFAATTGSIAVSLGQVPNQPITFKGDKSRRRTEDSLLAWGWRKYLDDTSDPEALLQLPMTKAVVRAMDCVTEFTKKKLGHQGVNVQKYLVLGASKRGWMTWTTAAVDKRVFAIAPIVMDLLNTTHSLSHHYRSLGGWTFAFKEYYELNLTERFTTPQFSKMMDIIDPLTYRDRLTMPKMIISATGDEFFLLDDSHYYYKSLSGPTFLRVLPNTDHTCFPQYFGIVFSLQAFYLHTLQKRAFPKFTWSRNVTRTGGSITLYTQQQPKSVKAYYARTLSEKRRDFRLLIASPKDSYKPYPNPVLWFPQRVSKRGKGVYSISYENPPVGWIAFFMKLKYPGVNGTTLEFTTDVNIIPDVFPFPACHGKECKGTLV